MGCSISPQKRTVQLAPMSSLFTYPHFLSLNIQTTTNESFERLVKVTDPLVNVTKILKITENPFYLSYCVLPGLDPQLDQGKICQDACCSVSDDDSLLLTLFDGHGELGEEVVKFCIQQVESLYSSLKEKLGVLFI
jgi:hypothetical protein